ncbi:hypothetical protein DVS28_b0091 (plasmid) [Euzebya pacifica]|uniref:Uncharacterized protein n=1 Tax=Euzebya pacifica TaxID=1608957 RepID=A0A346Y5W4_9ACTN|nr:hypothetical protein [Euzebya pacifica]AXV09861.1 hypothetical protein DVS28_b0091 [Euzebya pacifica]
MTTAPTLDRPAPGTTEPTITFSGEASDDQLLRVIAPMAEAGYIVALNGQDVELGQDDGAITATPINTDTGVRGTTRRIAMADVNTLYVY